MSHFINGFEAQNNFDVSQTDSVNIYDAYAKWTDSMAQYPPTAEPFYLALGIADECGELLLARGTDGVLKEAGDVLWYIARYSTRVLGVPFSELIDAVHYAPRYKELRSALGSVGVLCGIEKKRIRDGDTWDVETLAKKQRTAKQALVDVLVWVNGELDANGYTYTFIEAINANRAKLSARLEAGTIKGDGDNR